ncbi:transaldolase [Candidatus Daviesbacteria bacterium]|nr:transaldolase [Candidatus Daviesbacteria bacterium]
MKLANLKTKIFLDGGDPKETAEIKNLLGFLDGQTTNPTLISKNPDAAKRLSKGEKFSPDEIFEFYKQVVKEISRIIPEGFVSIEVYADANTKPAEMLKQGKEMFRWIPNAHIKYPTTSTGLEAAEKSVKENLRVNMTLVFSEEQAAAVYSATKGAKKGEVFVSPFVGRLDDKGENGMTLIENILKMYSEGDNHVEVLTASVRNLEHFIYALHLQSDIITAPYKILKQWGESGMPLPGDDFVYMVEGLEDIPYKYLDLEKDWRDFDIKHELTDIGIEKFSSDWNSLIK